jgi:hypothetical protein
VAVNSEGCGYARLIGVATVGEHEANQHVTDHARLYVFTEQANYRKVQSLAFSYVLFVQAFARRLELSQMSHISSLCLKITQGR